MIIFKFIVGNTEVVFRKLKRFSFIPEFCAYDIVSSENCKFTTHRAYECEWLWFYLEIVCKDERYNHKPMFYFRLK
jgi:hypothetical protein